MAAHHHKRGGGGGGRRQQHDLPVADPALEYAAEQAKLEAEAAANPDAPAPQRAPLLNINDLKDINKLKGGLGGN